MTKQTLAMLLFNVMATIGIGRAQPPVGTVSIPVPDNSASAFQTALRYDLGGDLYAWDGLTVWEQTGGSGSFQSIGSVAAGNQADAGPISFSQDGHTLLLSDGAGGFPPGAYNGVFWTMPVSGGTAVQVSGSVPYAYDALALPAASTIPASSTKYVVYQGNGSYSGGSVSILDSASGANQPVINNGPGATTSIAINPTNGNVYLGVFSLATYSVNIYSFTLGQIDNAYRTQSPLDFLSAGTLFNPGGTGSQSGGGMFFDNNGYLFSGGDGITVFNSSGAVVYDQPAGSADGYYDSLVFDPLTNGVLKVPSSSSTAVLYNAGDFEPAIWTNGQGGSWSSAVNWSGRPNTTVAALVFAGSTSGTAVVTLDGNQSAVAVQFGDATAASNYSITAGTGGVLSLGTTANGASISVVSGTHSISASIVLEGNLTVNAAAQTRLEISGDVGQDTGVSAALTLSGGGDLLLSGTNSFTSGVTILGGTLQMLNLDALPDGSSLTIGDPTAFSGALVSAAVSPRETAAVPEPGSLALIILGTIGIPAIRLVRRRRFA